MGNEDKTFEINDGVLEKYRGSETSFIIPEGVSVISAFAFKGCTNLVSVTIPSGVTGINASAFEDCRSLVSVTIPGSVTEIGKKAFGECTSLTSVHIPGSVTKIGNSAFHNCTSLTSIHIPGSVTKIGEEAFSECRSLASVTIPKGVTRIRSSTFRNCKALTSVTIPESVEEIEWMAFSNCTSLREIRYGDTKGRWLFELLGFRDTPEGVAVHCSDGDACPIPIDATEIVIPGDVKKIGADALRGRSSLTSVVIPAGVTEIGQTAFCGCELSEIRYEGTMEQWRVLKRKKGWAAYSSIRSVTCADGRVELEEIERKDPFGIEIFFQDEIDDLLSAINSDDDGSDQ